MVKFIFMLTKDDSTVADCLDVYDEVRDVGPRWMGFKDIGVGTPVLQELARRMHADGRKVVLEVVSTDQEAELRSVRAGLAIGVDILMGGTHAQTTLPLLCGSGLLYYPFPGRIIGHPSILQGSVDEIVESARELTSLDGVDGLDLLAYRWTGPVPHLVSAVVAASAGPVIVAGSIESADQIRIVAERGASAFTIGGAVFDRRLVPDGSIRDQVAWALHAAQEAGSRDFDAEPVLSQGDSDNPFIGN